MSCIWRLDAQGSSCNEEQTTSTSKPLRRTKLTLSLWLLHTGAASTRPLLQCGFVEWGDWTHNGTGFQEKIEKGQPDLRPDWFFFLQKVILNLIIHIMDWGREGNFFKYIFNHDWLWSWTKLLILRLQNLPNVWTLASSRIFLSWVYL